SKTAFTDFVGFHDGKSVFVNFIKKSLFNNQKMLEERVIVQARMKLK
ncbi:MAG: hypothetical protein ACJAS1_007149, partial [Oleiphilaceae bacterium]